jgi:hypothetical protein
MGTGAREPRVSPRLGEGSSRILTLTATTSYDIVRSAYYLYIRDVTIGTPV